jgi:TPR repeat protein
MGDDEAPYALGLLYDDQLKDYPKAIKWYEIAHNMGHKDSAYSLGLLYKDVLKDHKKALEWFQLSYDISANRRYPALYWIAEAYKDGLGVKQDLIKAKSLFQEVAENAKSKEVASAAKQALQSLDRNQSK